MAPPWALAVLVAFGLATDGAADLGDFRQSSSEPRVDKGSNGFTSTRLTVSWDTTADRTAPRILGYELQYAVAGRGVANDDTAAWQAVEGNAKDTWDITVRVDGFDRSIGKNHTVQDGWFTLALSRAYPKPSSLSDLRLVTEEIAWDDSWADMETKVQKALRESRHPQYSSWTADVVRCDETEQRGSNHWAGGCPFLEHGGYTWHLRLSPPAGDDALTALEDFPVVTVAKETITAKWSGQGDQVASKRYGFLEAEEGLGADGDSGDSENLLGPSTNLVDPFFCQRGSCVRSLEGLTEATPYLVRLRAYNRNGFGPWKASTTDMSLQSAEGTPGISTDAAPIAPTPRSPRLSSSTSSSLTVFVDTTGDAMAGVAAAAAARAEIEAYEFEIQPYEEGNRGDTSRWTPVIRSSATDAENEGNGTLGLSSPLVIATGLSPSTSYRFRVSGRHARGITMVSGISEVFTTGPGLPKPPPSAPVVDVASITSSTLSVTWSSWAAAGDEDAKKGGEYVFEAQWERLGSGFWQEATSVAVDRESQEWRATAEGLNPYSQHRFRVRAVNDVGAGEWSTAGNWARTEGGPSSAADHDSVETDVTVSASVLLSASGEARVPGHSKDFDYYHGVGTGGQVGFDGRGGDGGGGAAVIVARVPGVPLPARTPFFFTGLPELYAVPRHSGVASVTLKLWGAGGGGVLTATAAAVDIYGENGTSNATQVLGGGGGFLQVEVKVSPGETLEVLVGGGGGASHGEAGGEGGFNGGQAGGRGGGGAAGGGGSTSVLRRRGHRLVAAAGGGGGAGNADRCCAGGGAGGGERGEDGGSPAFDQAVVGTGGAGECQNGWCSASEVAAVSYEGTENWFTTGGGGGNSTQGGQRGNSDVFDRVDGGGGRQGAVSSPRGGETSIPMVFKGTSSRTATPGHSLSGGIGANGARSGGGGGGGFYGGGGGGSGEQGGGGGGGSSYADIGALVVEDTTSEWGQGGNGLRAVEIGESWVEVEWERVEDAVPGEEPMFYEVEISKGHGSEDFYLSARVDALDHYNPAAASSYPRAPGGAPPAVLRAMLLGLSPSSEFNVRVAAISRLGPGRPSAAFSFSTEALPTNKWERVVPRSSRPERRGRGLSGPDLGKTESWDTDLAAIQTEGGFSNPPTELRQELPYARSGHTLTVVAGKVYMFGGLSSSSRCSSAAIGSTALGDTPGGAATEDCVGGESYSAELWEYSPSLNVWTEVLVNGASAPAARGGHTASVAGSKMIIFGGRGNESDSDSQAGLDTRTALLGDEWAIDLDPSQHVTVATNSSTAIREGGGTFIPLVVDAEQQETDNIDMCVADISVAVQIDHSCTGQLQLTLYGPGPPPGDTSLPGNTPRAEPAVLFVGYNGTDGVSEDVDEFEAEGGSSSGGGCGDGLAVTFEDSADRGVWECCGNGSPFSGTFKAVDQLLVGRFLHMPAEGEWTLGVLDVAVDSSNGTVTSWSLDVEMRPCDWRSALRWSNVTSTEGRSPPPPRAHHTAAVVDGGFFVAGGTGAMGALSDLWRRGNSSSPSTSKGWTLLAEGSGAQLTPTGPMKPHGASIMVSPWGVLSLGGMRQGSGVGATSDLWVLDPVSKLWRSVSCGEDGRGASPWPVGRYHASTAIVEGSQEHTTDSAAEGDDSVGRLVLFGGKDDWRRLDDLWQLRLRSLSVTTSISTSQQSIIETQAKPTEEMGQGGTTSRPQAVGSWSLAEAGRDQRCAHFFVAGTANDTWHASCGEGADDGGGDGSCTIAAVLDMAWCLGEYQGVGSPH